MELLGLDPALHRFSICVTSYSVYTLQVIEGDFSICHLQANESFPDWFRQGKFYSLLSSPQEISVICESHYVPANIKAESEWMLFQIVGSIPFDAVGVLASVLNPLAEAQIGILALSSFDTDYIFVKAKAFSKAKAVLEKRGFRFT